MYAQKKCFLSISLYIDIVHRHSSTTEAARRRAPRFLHAQSLPLHLPYQKSTVVFLCFFRTFTVFSVFLQYIIRTSQNDIHSHPPEPSLSIWPEPLPSQAPALHPAKANAANLLILPKAGGSLLPDTPYIPKPECRGGSINVILSQTLPGSSLSWHPIPYDRIWSKGICTRAKYETK